MAYVGRRGISGDEPDLDIAVALKGLTFPASKDQIINFAMNNGVDQAIVNMLMELPDRQYESQQELRWGFDTTH